MSPFEICVINEDMDCLKILTNEKISEDERKMKEIIEKNNSFDLVEFSITAQDHKLFLKYIDITMKHDRQQQEQSMMNHISQILNQ